MTVEEPQQAVEAKKGTVPERFKDFHQACLWAKEHHFTDFTVPSTSLNENLRDDELHHQLAWAFLQAVEKVLTEGWCLLMVSRNRYVERSVVMYYDKTRDWLIIMQSENDFAKVEPADLNQGLRVVADPLEAFSLTFGSMKPMSDLTEKDFDKWYDSDGDFLYGEDVNYIKDSLRHSLHDDDEPYLVKVDLPADLSVRTINYFLKVFEPR